MDKIKVSQDDLKRFLEKHHFVRVALARKMGVSESIVGNCFNHVLSRHGKPLSFSKQNIERMNQALQQISKELSACKLICSDEAQATRRFVNDDPAIIDSLRKISEYIKLWGLAKDVLGWKQKKKCDNNIILKEQNPHVHLSKEEIELINTEILSVAGTLAIWEVVVDGDDAKPAERQVVTKEKGSRTRKDIEPAVHEWDNTDLPLQERSRLLHEHWPDGLLLFRVNGGYTAEGDDAIYINNVDESLVPFREPSSGLVTLWMPGDTMDGLLPRLVADGKRVAFTDMYKE